MANRLSTTLLLRTAFLNHSTPSLFEPIQCISFATPLLAQLIHRSTLLGFSSAWRIITIPSQFQSFLRLSIADPHYSPLLQSIAALLPALLLRRYAPKSKQLHSVPTLSNSVAVQLSPAHRHRRPFPFWAFPSLTFSVLCSSLPMHSAHISALLCPSIPLLFAPKLFRCGTSQIHSFAIPLRAPTLSSFPLRCDSQLLYSIASRCSSRLLRCASFPLQPIPLRCAAVQS